MLTAIFLIFHPITFGLLLAGVFTVLDLPQKYRKWALPAAAIAATVMYPFYQVKMFTIPVFGVWPDVATGVYMLVFVMMAVGLNIVVGYAGLLDLGYVAFYATGAYTAAWFASLQFPHASIHFGAVGLNPPNLPGIHITVWLLLPLAGIITAFIGIVIGLPTLRLRGDYLAIVTLGFGEILPQVARNSDNFLGTGFNLTNGPNGITPIDSIGIRPRPLQRDRRVPAVELPHVLQGEGPRPPAPVDRRVLLDGDRASALHGVLLAPAAVLAPRARVDRDPRGRDGRGGDGRAADADEDVGVRERRVLRRCRGRVLRGVQERDVPRRLLLQHLGVHPLHGHPRRDGEHLGRHRRRLHSSRTSTRKGSPTPAPGSTRTSIHRQHLRHPASTCRCSRPGSTASIILIVMLFRPEGLIPSSRPRRRAARGRPRRAAVRPHRSGAVET